MRIVISPFPMEPVMHRGVLIIAVAYHCYGAVRLNGISRDSGLTFPARRPSDWHVSWSAALAEAQSRKKPIFVFASPGGVDKTTCEAANIFRRNSLFSPAVAEILARDFVLLTHDRRDRSSVLAPIDARPVSPLTLATPPDINSLNTGEGASNFWCCVCDLNGDIALPLPGYMSEGDLLNAICQSKRIVEYGERDGSTAAAAIGRVPWVGASLEPYLYNVRRFCEDEP